MTLKITKNQCGSEAEALAILKEMGFYTYTTDVAGVENDFHWHDFDSTFFNCWRRIFRLL
jgi:hypothetical protein